MGIEVILEWLEKKFIGAPKYNLLPEAVEHGLDKSFLAQIIRCESTHFLSSAVSGWLVFSLIWIILSYNKPKCYDPYIFRFSFLCGLCASVTVHIFIDGFTRIA